MTTPTDAAAITRRRLLTRLMAGGAIIGLDDLFSASPSDAAAIDPKDALKITRLETLLVKPKSVFLKIHTNAGITGIGEPTLEGKPQTCEAAVHEIAPYLVGKDPRRVVHHWQAIYRHGFYRGGPLLTSVLSGIDQALWDIKGKALGVPVYELLGGPTRDKIRVYAQTHSVEAVHAALKQGFRTFKTGVAGGRSARIVENPAFVERVRERFAAYREAAGPECDIGIDFHGAVPPPTAMLLIKALEPYQPMFFEEIINCQDVELMAEMAKKTHIPIATGERIFTKWGFRDILEKRAASVIQPDLCHAGGISEVRIIAGMAEAYYVGVAPHNPLGPISLAAGIQMAASIPNFVCQEQITMGEGILKTPFQIREGYVDLPTGPGLGIELDDDKVADLVDPDLVFPLGESYDADDGSVADW